MLQTLQRQLGRRLAEDTQGSDPRGADTTGADTTGMLPFLYPCCMSECSLLGSCLIRSGLLDQQSKSIAMCSTPPDDGASACRRGSSKPILTFGFQAARRSPCKRPGLCGGTRPPLHHPVQPGPPAREAYSGRSAHHSPRGDRRSRCSCDLRVRGLSGPSLHNAALLCCRGWARSAWTTHGSTSG